MLQCAGVPFHAAENYISRLIDKGYKVAICEQLEDPKECKGIVKRDVIRVVTPGTVTESNMLDEKKNNYIMSVFKKGMYFGMAVCDVTTGDFFATEIKDTNNFAKLIDEISKYSPAEIIVNTAFYNTTEEISKIKERLNSYITNYGEDTFTSDYKQIQEKYKFENDTEKEINNLEDRLFEVSAINGLLDYLLQTQKVKLEHINKIKLYYFKKHFQIHTNNK